MEIFSQEITIDKNDQGFAVFFGYVRPSILSTEDHFNLYLKPDPVNTYDVILELQDDDDGNGIFANALDDKFQKRITLAAGPDWVLISELLSEFNDVSPGGDGAFNPDVNGKLLAVVFLVDNAPPSTTLSMGLDFIHFTTGDANQAPVVTVLSDTTATEDEPFQLQIQANDPDGDMLFYSLIQGSPWLTMDDFTGLLSGTPEQKDVGVGLVTIFVDDGKCGIGSFSFNIEVFNVNDTPVIAAISDTFAIETRLFELQVVADDEDGDRLAYSLPQAPSWLTINVNSGLMSGTPAEEDVGIDSVTVQVDDGHDAMASISFVIEVLDLLSAISVSPSTLNFGNVCLDSTGTAIVIIRSDGLAELEIDSLIFSNADFVSNLSGQLLIAPGDSEQIVISFTPTQERVFNEILTIANNTPDSNFFEVPLNGVGIAAEISGDILVNFQTTRVGDLDTVAYQLSNVGPCDLRLDSLTITGTHTSDFFVLFDDLTPQLPPDSSHEFRLVFAPSDSGLRTAILQIFTNDPDANPFGVVLRGIGDRVPVISVSPLNLDFGEVCLDSTSMGTLTIHNDGTADLTIGSINFDDDAFDYAGGVVEIIPGDSMEFIISFSPNAERTFSAIATIVSNDPDTSLFEIPLTGIGIASEISDAAQVTFQPTQVRETDTASYILSNNGACDLRLDSFVITGTHSSDFLVLSGDLSPPLLPGASREFRFVFSPADSGSRTATLQIFNNDPDHNPFEVNLLGNGLRRALIAVSPPSLDFGEVCLDSASAETIIIRNEGTADLEITSLIFSDPAFSSTTQQEQITPGDSIAITLSFKPDDERVYAELLTLVSNADDSGRFEISLNGVGITPAIAGVSQVIFTSTQVGKSDTVSYQLSNTGACDLLVDSLVIVGSQSSDFSVAGNFNGAVIAVGASLELPLVFSPSDPDLRNATLQIFNNDPDANPFNVSLTGNGIRVAVISVSLASLNFGDVCLDSSAIERLTVFNIGTDNLVIDLLNFDDPAFTNTAREITIVPGDSAFFDIGFAPTAERTYSGIATIVNNDPDNGLLGVPLNGSGVAPEISGAGEVVFAATQVGASDTVIYTVSNIGVCDLRFDDVVISGIHSGDFSVAPFSLTPPLAPGASRDMTLVFAPTDSGVRTASLTISNNDPANNPFIVSLIGGGARRALISISPASLNFGDVCLDSIGTSVLTVRNDGTADLSITSLTFSEPSFSSATGQVQIDPGESAAITVLFNPDTESAFSGTLTIASNAADSSSYEVSLNGVGVAPEISGAGEVTFSTTRVGETDIATYQLSNLGPCPLRLDSLVISGAHAIDFAVVPGDLSPLPPNSSRDLLLTFAPSDSGVRTATLSIFNNDPAANPFTVNLSGNGERVAVISVSPASLDFGDVCLDSTGIEFLTIRNDGTADLAITSLTFSDAAFGSSAGPLQIVPGGSAQIEMTFFPDAAGAFNGMLTIASNAADSSSYEVSLSGIGVTPAISGASQIVFSQTQLGNADTVSYFLTNTGVCDLRLDSLVIGGVHVSDFAVVSGTLNSVPPNASRELVLSFAPSDSGVRIGTLSIFNNVPNANPFIVDLIGGGSRVAVISVSPALLDFGEICLDSTGTEVLTVRNSGTADLVINSLNFDDAAFSSAAQNVVIPPGDSTDIVILFRPQQEQLFFANATIVNNDPDNSLFSVDVRGSGITPAIAGVSQVIFTSTQVGKSDTVSYQLSNTGACDLLVDSLVIVGSQSSDFSVAGNFNGAVIAVGASLELPLVFSPSDPDLRNATLQIFNNDPDANPFNVSLTGNGIRVAVISVSPASLNFGDVCLDSSAIERLTVFNIGTDNLVIDLLNFDDPAFTNTAREITIVPGDSAFFDIGFAPTAERTYSGIATIVNNDPDNGLLGVPLNGSGVAPEISGAGEVVFAATQVGASDTVIYTVSNIGVCDLRFDDVVISGIHSGDFSVAPFSLTPPLAPGASRDMTLVFAPTDSGVRTASLTISNNDPANNPFIVSLIGGGARRALISISPASLNFGDVCLDSIGTSVLTVRNDGTADLSITSLTFSEPSFSSATGQVQIDPGESAAITVLFNPDTESAFSGTLTIASNAADSSSYEVSLNGVGVAPEISGAGEVTFSTTRVGETDIATYQLSNLGPCPLRLDSLVISGAHAIDFAFLPGDLSPLPPNSSRDLLLTFAPSDSGVRTATLSIFNNDPAANPFTVNLSGNGERVAVISVSPASLDFGDVCLDSTGIEFLTIRNDGTADLAITSLTFSDAAFGSSAGPLQIVPGGSAQIEMIFFPDAAGAFNGMLTIASNAADSSSYEVSLSGIGVTPAISGASQIVFSQTQLGNADTVSYFLTNTGVCDLRLDSLVIGDVHVSDFAVVSGNLNSVPPNASRELVLSFAPSDSGVRIGTLSIFNNVPNANPFIVDLIGGGSRVAVISVSPALLDFGEICLDSTGTEVLTVRNSGTADLVINSLNFDDAAFSSSAQNVVIPPGDSTDIVILFRPQQEQLFFANATIVNNDPDNSLFSVDVRGSGITPAIAGVSQVIFTSTQVGKSDTVSYQLSNTGACDLLVDSLVIVGSQSSDFSVAGNFNGAVIAVGASLELPLVFSPSDPDLRNATLQIFNNDPDANPFNVSLTGNGIRVAVISVSPASLNFGDVCLDSSAIERLTVFNIGTDNLVIDLLNFDDPAFTNTAREITIVPGDSAFFDIGFAPTAERTYSGIATIVNNDPDNGLLGVPLNGSGVAPEISGAGEVVFAATQVGASDTVIYTVSNIGVCDLRFDDVVISGIHSGDFSVAPFSLTPPLAPGASRDMTLVFAPTDSGVRTASLTISNNDPDNNPFIVSLIGGGARRALISISPASLNFGDVCLDSTGTSVLTVRNDGTADLSITSLTFSESTFSSATGQVQIDPGESAVITVLFNPDTESVFSGTLTIASNADDSSSYEISLSGVGVAPEISGAGEVTFSTTRVGAADTVFYELSNLGPCPLRLDSLVLSGAHAADFAVVPGDLSPLPSNSSRDLLLTFAPSDSGVRTATLSIFNNDPAANPFTVNLSGNGERVAVISVSPASFDFGDVCLDSTGIELLTIRNDGTTDLAVTSLAFSNGSFGSSAGPLQIIPGGSAQIEMIFFPDAAGVFNGTLTIASNAPDSSSYEVSLSGVGVTPAISGASQIVFPQTRVGEANTVSYFLTNTGVCDLRLDSLVIGGLHASDFVVVSENLNSVPPNASRELVLSFAPFDSGVRTGTLSIFNNDPNANPFVVDLIGGGSRVAVISVSPALLDFGEICLDSTGTEVLTVRNSGTADLVINSLSFDDAAFSSAAQNVVIAPGDTTQIEIIFSPDAGQSFFATATLLNNDFVNGPLNISLNGEGITAEISGAVQAAFSSTRVGKSDTVSYTFLNTGPCVLRLDSLVITGLHSSDFAIVDDFSSEILDVENSLKLQLVFSPSDHDLRTAALQIFTNDPAANPFSVSLVGNGIRAAVISLSPADSLNFGNICLDSTFARTLTVRNTGTENLVVDLIHFNETAFSNADRNIMIVPGDSAFFDIEFTPTEERDYTGIATIVNNDPDSGLFEIALSGTGVAPEIDGSNFPIFFSSTRLGETDTVAYRLSNLGDFDLRINSLVITGQNRFDFSIIGEHSGQIIPPGNFLHLLLEFAPLELNFAAQRCKFSIMTLMKIHLKSY